jgi:hypothetical protein
LHTCNTYNDQTRHAWTHTRSLLTHTRSLFTHICNTDDDQTTVQYTREEWRGLHTWNTDNDVMLQSKETYYSVKRDPLRTWNTDNDVIHT